MLRGCRDRDRKAPVNSVPITKKLSNSIPDHGKGIYSIPFFGQDFQDMHQVQVWIIPLAK